MNIINEIKHNSFVLKEFVTYCIEKKYNINSILVNENHLDTIMYYVEFLEYKQVYIITDHNGYMIYKQFDENIQVTIECKFIPSVIARYIFSIIAGFNYLENPF